MHLRANTIRGDKWACPDLKLRPPCEKMRAGRGKPTDTAFFKPKNTKNYVNARARKSLRRKRDRVGQTH